MAVRDMGRVLSALTLLLLVGSCAAVAVGPPRPLILVPGLMGSILQKHTFEAERIEQIFPLLLEQTSHLPDLYCACRLYEDEVGSETDEDDDHLCHSPLPDQFEVVVPADNAGLYALDLLMPNELLEANRKPYFHDMIAMLEGEHGYAAGETLFGFPYDWRQPTSHVAELLAERVREVLEMTGAEQVDIVSHSLGCLVTQAYLSLPLESEKKGMDGNRLEEEEEREVEEEIHTHPLVHTHVAAGGPYGGIGGGWTILTLWGFQYDQVMIMPWNLHQLLIQFPSTYDFIARSIAYIDEWDAGAEGYRGEPVPTFSFEREGDTVTIAAGGGECLDIVRSALLENSLNVHDDHEGNCPIPFRDDLLANAMATLEEIEANIRPPAVFHIIYGVVGDSGWSVHFPRDVTSENDYSVLLGLPHSFLGTPPFLFDLTACVRGDGVVPQVSTTRSHMSPSSISYFQVQHSLLVEAELDSYEHLLGISCPWTSFWQVELLNVNGVEFIQGDGVGVVDFCPDREPSQGDWLCEGELCGHYDTNADVATAVLKLQQEGWKVSSLQDDLTGVDSSTITHLEGRLWKDRLVATAQLESGERLQFHATQSRDCQTLSGYYTYDWEPESQFLFSATRRDSGTVHGQCQTGSTRPCSGPNEAGEERCKDGFWMPCTACEEGYRYANGFPYDSSRCEVTSAPPSPSASPAPSPSSSPSPSISVQPSPSPSSNATVTSSAPQEEGLSDRAGDLAVAIGIILVVFVIIGVSVYFAFRYRAKIIAKVSGKAVIGEEDGIEMEDIDVDNTEHI